MFERRYGGQDSGKTVYNFYCIIRRLISWNAENGVALRPAGCELSEFHKTSRKPSKLSFYFSSFKGSVKNILKKETSVL